MNKSIFKLSKMDCSSEEQLVRMKLDGLEEVRQLSFDLPGRALTVVHTGDIAKIAAALRELNLGDAHISTEETHEQEAVPEKEERKLLVYVLAINAFFFVLEMTTGLISHSMGLIADSLDMLADALVYGLSLLAVGSTAIRKKRVARASGYFQLALAVIGLLEVLRRFFGLSEVPIYSTMIFISILALLGNITSLVILRKTKSNEAHIKASQIFTSNDVIINGGVIMAGILVYFTASKLPDLIIGSIVFVIVVQGALRILKLAR
jgi:Co/Zn/Cd efflux system component